MEYHELMQHLGHHVYLEVESAAGRIGFVCGTCQKALYWVPERDAGADFSVLVDGDGAAVLERWDNRQSVVRIAIRALVKNYGDAALVDALEEEIGAQALRRVITSKDRWTHENDSD